MGDLLFRIGNIAGKADVDEDGADAEELPSMDASRKAILDTLGKERRDRVLAAIYIIRQDQSGIVRSTSVTVWKALVQVRLLQLQSVLSSLTPGLTEYAEDRPRNHADAQWVALRVEGTPRSENPQCKSSYGYSPAKARSSAR